MPASGAVDGGLCAVGAGGEVERGVGRYSSAIYGKEKGMRPKRYPYSGKLKASTTGIVKAWEKDCSEILQKQITSIEEKLALLYNE